MKRWLWEALTGADRVGRRLQAGQRWGPYRSRTQVPVLPGVGREVIQHEVTQGAVEVLAYERWMVSSPGHRLPGLQTPDTHPFAHLQKWPTALVGTGRHQLPRHGQGRQGPRHSHCATSQPPGSPTGAGHRHVPGSQAHSGTVPGARGKGTQRQGRERERGRQGEETQSQSERRGAEREKESDEQGRREWGKIKRQISKGRDRDRKETDK